MAQSYGHKARRPRPFCQKQFVGQGNHLSRCRERHGRDYSVYLSDKTLAKRSGRLTSSKTCPHCHKHFHRLDTHLHRNATCRRIALSVSQSTSQCNTDSVLSNSPATSEQEQSVVEVGLDLQSKRCLFLPRTDEEWQEADTYFRNHLVPCVQEATWVDEKNNLLTLLYNMV